MDTSIKNPNNFNDTQVNNLVAYISTLKRIHQRLLQEGYIIKNGIFIKPIKKDIQKMETQKYEK